MKKAILRLNRTKKGILLAIMILGSLGWIQGAQAQEYPTRSITLLIGFAPGGGVDTGSRLVIQEATKMLGQEFIPVNRPGGAGVLTTGLVANAKGDGYTLGAISSSNLTIAPHIEAVVYDPLKDLTPVTQFGVITPGIVVRSDSPFKTFKELIEFARKNPGKINCGVPGTWTSTHIVMEYVIMEEKVDIAVVPFAGAGPAATALLGGHVSLMSCAGSGWAPHFKAGKMRVLATAADKRLAVAPDAPTLLELGYPNAIFTEINLTIAPKGVPADVIKKLDAAFLKSMQTPSFKTGLENLVSYTENPLSGQKLKDYIDGEHARMGDLIKKIKLLKK